MEGEDEGRTMGELGSEMMTIKLKINVSGKKHRGGNTFNTQTKNNNNDTGEVRKLVLGFKMKMGSDIDLKSTNHESRF